MPEMTGNPETNIISDKSHCPVWLPATILALTIFFVYWPATTHDFISLDDPEYVTANSHVQSGLTVENVKWAFSNVVVGNWHPITMLSHMLDCQLFGLKPWGHHLTSIAFHSLNTALLFLLLQRLTGALWRSIIVAALFGLHPMHVESVAWVAERKDVLSTFFGILTLLMYAKYARPSPHPNPLPSHPMGAEREQQEKPSAQSNVTKPNSAARIQGKNPKLFYLLSLAMFACGLMCKPMLVTIPLVMLLLDFWPLNRVWAKNLPKLFIEKIPFFVLTLAACVTTWLLQSNAMLTLQHVSGAAKLENAAISYVLYIGKLFWPMHLAIFYPFPAHVLLWQAVASGVLIAGITIFCIAQRLQRPYLLTGWLWYLGMLVPVIGLVQVGAQAMADRYTYLPYTGLFIMIVWGGHELARRWQIPQTIPITAACVALIAFAGVTRWQLGFWQNNSTLYPRAIAVTDNNYLMHYFLGVELFNERKLDEAIDQYQEAISIEPNYAAEHFDLGNALALKGKTDSAAAEYREAIRQKPDYHQAWHALGILQGKNGQTADAIKTLQEAVQLQPGIAQYHYDLGLVLLLDNQADSAITQFQEAIQIKPDFTQARQYLAAAQRIKNGAQKMLP
ncbi:MAG TPA: tetratricopeptide repeat protein [Verrucomicrobiae bacterium]|jgi:cytochrome c-type biogenesis protein CcmH/NrfG